MAAHRKFADVSDAINAGIENLNKWYWKIDDTNVYFICLGTCLIRYQIISWTDNLQLSIQTGSLHTRVKNGTSITLMPGLSSWKKW
jgi:hypothetical protein